MVSLFDFTFQAIILPLPNAPIATICPLGNASPIPVIAIAQINTCIFCQLGILVGSDLSTATGNGFSFLANINEVLVKGVNACYRL